MEVATVQACAMGVWELDVGDGGAGDGKRKGADKILALWRRVGEKEEGLGDSGAKWR